MFDTKAYLALATAYGTLRGIARTYDAKVQEYDYDSDHRLQKFQRPIMITERIAAVLASTVFSVGCAPLVVSMDVYNMERRWRGYKTREEPFYSIFQLVLW